jgi:hypothetical protein
MKYVPTVRQLSACLTWEVGEDIVTLIGSAGRRGVLYCSSQKHTAAGN